MRCCDVRCTWIVNSVPRTAAPQIREYLASPLDRRLEHRVLGSGPPGLWESLPHGKIKIDSGYRTFALGQRAYRRII
jgi:hypothetical protein